jgi:1,4-alpha-glucan branching enzyme
MKRYPLLLVLFCAAISSNAQRLLSWSPEFPVENSTLNIIVDCNKGNQGLLNFEGGNSANVYVHVGVLTNLSTGPSDWRYVKFAWATTDPLAKATPLGSNKYQYTITNIRTFFGVPAGETIKKVNVIFRNGTGTLKQVNSDNSDMYLPVYGNTEYAVRLNLPPFEPRFIPWVEPLNVAVGGSMNITGVSFGNAALTLKLNGVTIGTAANTNTISASPTIAIACEQKIILEGNDGNGIKKDSFSFYIPPPVVVAPLPAGAKEGINYAAGNTAATLVLFAPNKTNVTVIGDFSNWQTLCSNQMNRTPDGNFYWITITGLTPGAEYGYQYVVDNAIKIADPYAEKILDPWNDQFINAITYPNLKPYPTGLTTDLVSVLQTAAPQYNWQVTNFVKPNKKNLIIYELLIRDFTAEHSYQSLIDSLQYFKNLGINAIELMPVQEFDGNESWGYNPAFYFAPDKYYGTKNKLKEFIDKCHQNGIAVLLDVVYNHITGAAPQAKLYWDAANNKPAANNPWLNQDATHPYSVFNDFNHTSIPTQNLVKRSLGFWLSEYKIDGFRFDLAKGFSQTNTTTITVENYDASRIVNLKRYYDTIVQNTPSAYAILEFLGGAPTQEEQEYAAYGFMLWGNSNPAFNQCTMGYTSSSDLRQMVYNDAVRNFNNPAVVGYSQSHDEERTMYKNLLFGNAAGSYNVKNLATALRQEEAAAAILLTIPGPKQLWQFQERGYDSSINANGGRTANKPPLWHYMNDANRRALYNTYSKMIQFRLANTSIFNNTSFSYDLNGGLYKILQIADPAAGGLKVTVVSNMDVTAQTKQVVFQSTGDWKNVVGNGTGTGINGPTDAVFNITTTTQLVTLQPGEYHIYISLPTCVTAVPAATTPVNYCQNATTVPLAATGNGLLWYTTATGGTGSATAPTPSASTVGSTTYYVSQTIGCESPRLPIVVNVTATTPEPAVTTPVTYCQNATPVALNATGTALLWYNMATGGTGSATAPTPPTTAIGNTIYYVSQTLACGESPRAAITVTVSATTPVPAVTTPIAYCQNATATALTATGTSLLWYTTATGGTGSTAAPTPSTTTTGNTIFYVSQTLSCGEGQRAAIIVTINATPAAPMATGIVNYCQNAAANLLTATGTGLSWYTAATGGTGVGTAPTPSTSIAGTTNYYVSQKNATGCESPRASIAVIVTALAVTPTVTSPVTYCENASAAILTATGTGLLWYTVATGGTGSATAPTPSSAAAGTTNYYVSQTNTCGESPRAVIAVNVTATPGLPTGLNVSGITTATAVLNWATQAGIFYTVDYKATNAVAWTSAATNVSAGSVSLGNLAIGTTYDWRVSANCSPNPVSNYAAAQFITAARNSTIADIKNGFGIKIAPNPVTNNAVIDYIVPGNGTVTIILLDAFGRQMQVLYQRAQIQGQYVLPITNQLNGIGKGYYFLRIQQNSRGYFTRFMKQ